MIERCGVVVDIAERCCRVRFVDQRCADCPGHCAVRLGGSRELDVLGSDNVAVGDVVRVAAPGLSLAAVITFLPSLLLLVGFGSAAPWFGMPVEAGALVGLISGVALARFIAGASGMARWLRPTLAMKD